MDKLNILIEDLKSTIRKLPISYISNHLFALSIDISNEVNNINIGKVYINGELTTVSYKFIDEDTIECYNDNYSFITHYKSLVE